MTWMTKNLDAVLYVKIQEQVHEIKLDFIVCLPFSLTAAIIDILVTLML